MDKIVKDAIDKLLLDAYCDDSHPTKFLVPGDPLICLAIALYGLDSEVAKKLSAEVAKGKKEVERRVASAQAWDDWRDSLVKGQ